VEREREREREREGDQRHKKSRDDLCERPNENYLNSGIECAPLDLLIATIESVQTYVS
jgi:hypothetical protein